MYIRSEHIKVEMIQYLDKDGNAVKSFDDIQSEELLDMYQWMVDARVFDNRAMKYQRQGRIGTYAPFRGQEAAQVGSAFALREQDWIYPSYREAAASLVRGMDMSQFFLYTMGHIKGLSNKDVNIFPVQIIIAAQCLHAVGGAWASKYKKLDEVSVAYVGDGGTSEGDFHEALNFAGVYKLPVIFFVQNNQWAISVPISKQTASKSIAQKALAYGIDGIQVDGNDIIAVNKVMKDAIEHAKNGKPILIEAVTYRQGPHTTADDEKKYRNKEEENKWMELDPIKRMKALLISKGLLDEELNTKMYEDAEKKVTQAFEIAINTSPTTLQDIFNNVYEEKTPQLIDQFNSLEGNN